MFWQCDSLMLTSSGILWLTAVYLIVLQCRFLRHSRICTVPVYMSKNVVGITVLAVAFYGNKKLQTLTTYLVQNSSYRNVSAMHAPAQLASIVGIMTGTLIQMWFNPRLVTQTGVIFVASVVNWLLVFILEAFVFPYQSTGIPSSCVIPSSTNCFVFEAIPHTCYGSAVVAATGVAVAIGAIYLHSRWTADSASSPNSLLRYFNTASFASVVTTLDGCTRENEWGYTSVDHGILLIKNMLQVSSTVVTRTCNLQYELVYELIPTTSLKSLYSRLVGSILVFHVKHDAMTHHSSYKLLHEMCLAERSPSTGYLS
ncbi:hypothetical protein ACHHYP_06661 [Achlya hypogyna]|uniref:Uncharacterized protein n=1 Tax=Achlya hypogyna TaxID=1202772 RepID=A0A1V9YT46_ACHHY|nr:hypothetical protein ACHHYP_06661 [Achlya hypogyna]